MTDDRACANSDAMSSNGASRSRCLRVGKGTVISPASARASATAGSIQMPSWTSVASALAICPAGAVAMKKCVSNRSGSAIGVIQFE
jgi:hypothetical protein